MSIDNSFEELIEKRVSWSVLAAVSKNHRLGGLQTMEIYFS